MKIVFSTILSILMLSAMASAVPGTPQPFVVIVDTYIPSDAVGMEVIVSDMTHPYTMVLKTNDKGEVAGDWGNSPVKGETGDLFEITVGSIKVNTVMQDFGLGDYGIVHVNLMETTRNCPDDVTPFDIDTCPVKEVIKEVVKEVPVEVIKEVIKEVPVEKDCPVESDTTKLLLSILGSLIVGTGIGLSIYRDGKTGKIKFSIKSHRHFGRDALHSIYTVHRTNAHGYGEPIPVYKDGKYVTNDKYPMK